MCRRSPRPRLIRIPHLPIGVHGVGGGRRINAPQIAAQASIERETLGLAGTVQQMVQGQLHGVDIRATAGDVLQHDGLPFRGHALMHFNEGRGQLAQRFRQGFGRFVSVHGGAFPTEDSEPIED